MKTAAEWFAEYGESHQNPTNKLIHWICVPLIVFSVLGLLWSIPVPSPIPYLNVATIVGGLALLFYFRLSATLGLGMVVVLAVMLGLLAQIEASGLSVLWVSVVIFVGAWVGQFYGHQIEGKKPSFLKDVQFLLIGPIWLLHFAYARWGVKV